MSTDPKQPGTFRGDERVMELLQAVRLCFRNEMYLAAVSLAYIAVDTMASLCLPEGEGQNTRKHFLEWVERYLLADSGLRCTALELYAARCGLLHAQSPRSELGDKGKARYIWYSYRTLTAEAMERGSDSTLRAGQVVGVRIEDLLYAVEVAHTRFRKAVTTDAKLAALVSERGHQLFLGFKI